MKRIIFLLQLIPVLCYSQLKVSGTIHSENVPLPFATLELHNDSMLVSYAVCDKGGNYQLFIDTGTYTFEVNHLGFHRLQQEKTIDRNQRVNFSLTKKPTPIDEVVVQAKALDAIISNDTTIYNLDKVLNGTEENLEDVLKKLPGIQIDANGKIKSEGKQIDKLLIDGKEFFGDQHQLATKNISSEMIEGVSKYNNYRGKHEITEQILSDKTALNIKIDENFKGKLKGNTSIKGGLNHKYSLKANVFSFSDKLNVFWLANSNSVGNRVFTFEDYLGFQGGITELTEENATSIVQQAPSFIFTNRNSKEQKEHFSGLNISYVPSDKIKINTYTIFDNVVNLTNQFTNQYFYDGQNNLIQQNTKSKGWFNNTFLEVTFKPNEKSVLNYISTLSLDKSKEKKHDGFNSFQYNTDAVDEKIKINQNAVYSSLIGKDSKYTLSILNSISKTPKQLTIRSNQAILASILDSVFDISQSIDQNSNTLRVNNTITHKISKFVDLKWGASYSTSKQNFNSNLNEGRIQNDLTVKHTVNQLDMSVFYKGLGFCNYDIGVKYDLVRRNDSQNNLKWLPYSHFKFRFDNANQLRLSYSKNIAYPQIDYLINQPLISSFNRYFQNKTISLNEPAITDEWQLNYFLNDLFSNMFLNFGLVYSKEKQSISTEISSIGDHYNLLYVRAPPQSSFYTHLMLDKKFDNLPLSFIINNSFRLSEDKGWLNNMVQRTKIQVYNTELSVISNLKNPILNFLASYKFSVSETNNIERNIITQQQKSAATLEFIFTYNNLKVNLENTLSTYKSQTNKLAYYKLNPSIKYHKQKSKWSFLLIGNDVLNTSKNQIIETDYYSTHFNENVIDVLGGYLILGIEFKF